MSQKNTCNVHPRALVALGANLPSDAGAPDRTLRAALAMLAGLPGMRLTAVSRFWRTPAHPAGSGPDYVNAAAALETGLAAPQVLAALHGVEAALGRTRQADRRWAARGIDLDLIALDGAVLPDAATQDRWRTLPPDMQADMPPGLILPHPRVQDRAFVLVPLAEIAPRWTHPRLGVDTAALLDALPLADRAAIRPALP